MKLRSLEFDLSSLFSQAERALCSKDDAFLAGLIDNVNSVADEIVSLARPLRQTYENEGKLNEAHALKRRLDPPTVDRVNFIIKRLGERRSQ